MSVSVMIANDGADDEAALKYAFGLAASLEVPLAAKSAMPDPSAAFVYSASEYAVGAGALTVARVREAQDQTIADIQAMFERVLAEQGMGPDQASYRHIVASAVNVAGDTAILSDGIVFPRSAGRSEHALTAAFEHVLIDRRLPVLLSGPAGQPAGPVIIAWDGSDEVARSVKLHEGLICLHTHAVIAQNPDDLKSNGGGDATSADRLAEWLSARDIKAEKHPFTGRISEGLLRIAEQSRADMIIAGAYGHSRMGQFLFGGASRSLLKAKEGPALALAH